MVVATLCHYRRSLMTHRRLLLNVYELTTASHRINLRLKVRGKQITCKTLDIGMSALFTGIVLGLHKATNVLKVKIVALINDRRLVAKRVHSNPIKVYGKSIEFEL